MFLFQISSYDDSALDDETEELLRQRLETHSRRTRYDHYIWRKPGNYPVCSNSGGV